MSVRSTVPACSNSPAMVLGGFFAGPSLFRGFAADRRAVCGARPRLAARALTLGPRSARGRRCSRSRRNSARPRCWRTFGLSRSLAQLLLRVCRELRLMQRLAAYQHSSFSCRSGRDHAARRDDLGHHARSGGRLLAR